jgi:hypothetical protein
MIWRKAKMLPLMALAFMLAWPCSISAKKINGDNDLVAELLKEVVGDSETLKMIKKNLKYAENDYSDFNGYRIEWGTAADFAKMGDRFFVISYNAKIYSQNPENAIFSLLYEKEGSNELDFTKHYLTWIGQTEIEGFGSLSTVALCALFENMVGATICDSVRTEDAFTSEIEELEARIQEKISRKADKAHSHSASDITEGKLVESLIDDSICRDAELAVAVSTLMNEINLRPIPDVGIDVDVAADSAEVEALKAQIDELQKTVARLSALLEGVTREGSELIFSGMNINVVSGSGATDAAPNGLGNLTIGYNEKDMSNQESIKLNAKGGSHNLIIGKGQSYTSYGGFVAGASNSVSAPYATVTGGFNNSADGSYASVDGGQLNVASGDYATVSGGLARKAEGNNNWSAGEQTSVK